MTSERCRVILSKDAPDFPAGANTEIIRSSWDNRQGLRRMFYQSFVLGRQCEDAVLLTTDSKVPLRLPESCRVVTLVTDLAVFRLPEVYQRSRALWWRFQYQYLQQRAALFLAVSEFTRSEIADVFGIPKEKIYVVPCACAEEIERVNNPALLTAARRKYGLPEKYILFVGNNNPRKNLARMIRAFDLMKEQTGLPHQLIIAGEQGWRFDPEKALKDVKFQADVHFIGFVPDEDIPALYSAAALFLFPTLYEGFGMPALEAQRCGAPVVTSNVTALPETAGDGAEYVDPYDVESISAGMRRVLEDAAYSQALVRRGYDNAKRFSWEHSAGLLEGILKEEFAQ